MALHHWLIWIGAALTVAGLAGLAWCIVTVARAKRAGASEEALRLRMRRVLAVNMGALAFSTVGLMAVVIGVMLAP